MVILMIAFIRGCAAITRTAHAVHAPYNPRRLQWRPQPQFQFNPPRQNQWPDKCQQPRATVRRRTQ